LELKISIDTISLVSLILKFLKGFFNQHPNTKLQLSFEVLNGTLERLIDGEVDFAITPMHEGLWNVEKLVLTKSILIPVMHKEFFKGKKVTDNLLIKERSMEIFLVHDKKKAMDPVARKLWGKMNGELEVRE